MTDTIQTSELPDASTERMLRRRQLLIENAPPILTAAAVVAGTVLRWMHLGKRSLWFDEGYTAWAVSHPLREIIRVIRADTAPPLYYLILHDWTLLLGRSEAAMRSLSALFATATLLLFVVIARGLLKNPWAVMAATWIFALSFVQVSYAHEARFYSMMAFLGALDLYLVLLVCERSSSWRLTVLVLAWTASFYTNNVMAVYFGCLGFAWLILPGERPLTGRLRDMLIVGAISSLAFAAWVPSLLGQMSALRGHFWPDVPNRLDLETTISVMTGVREQAIGNFWFGRLVIPGVAAVDITLMIFVLTALRNRRQAAIAGGLAVFGILPVCLIYFYSHVSQSIYMDRAFIVSSVAMPLMAVLPLAAAVRPPRRAVVAAGLLLLSWYTFWSLPSVWLGTQDEDWRSAMAFAVQTPAKHRLVVFVANEGELFYDYYIRHGDYSPRSDLVGAPSSFFAVDPPHTMRHVESDADLNGLRKRLTAGKFDELVFVASHNWFADPPHRTLTLLQSKLPLLDQKTISRITVFRFGPPKKSTPVKP